MDDVILNKVAIVEKCLQRIHEEYDGHEDELEHNYTKQDAILLNLLRACEAVIDLGMRLVRLEKLGIPQSSRDVFVFLEQSKKISPEVSEELQKMVGFRNIAVHDYQKMNLTIVHGVIKNKLRYFQEFCRQIMQSPE
ncbi:DUF86 domain-containing protein [Simkania negevensis]|uniref:DUF86 domain-containing protein n=1 Tax=Simkania negevensis TaxID=83561 RepID=A0ABS3AQ31_9BACT|nr:DUF86 domain-containing protein [Simkania negevensis]